MRKLRAYLTGQGATAMMGKSGKVARMGELEDLKPLPCRTATVRMSSRTQRLGWWR